MELVSINEIASKKLLESSDPTPFELVILGTLMVVENPMQLYDFLKIRIKPQMFSEGNRPMAALLFDMLETGEPLRNYRIIELATQKGLTITKEDILNIRYQHAETDFEELCVSFVDKWYEFSLNQSGLQYCLDIENGIHPKVARRELDVRDNQIEDLKLGAKDVDYGIYSAAAKAIENIEKRKNDKSFISGKQTGIYKLDRMLGGLEKGELYFFVGSAGEGKTTLVMQCITNVSTSCPVDFYSLEMSKEQLAPKVLSAQTGVSTINMKLGRVTDDDLASLKNSLAPISELKMSIIDDVFHIDELERNITLRVKKYNVECVAIDNLTTIQHNLKGSRDDIEIAITYRLKHLAVKLNIPIALLVHKNKDSTNRLDKRPITSDIKFAGGAVAADVVIFPYTPKLESEDKGDNENATEIVITKNRSTGLEGYIPMVFVNDWNMYCEMDTDGNAILPNRKMFPASTPSVPQNIITGVRGTLGEGVDDGFTMPKGNTDTDLPF